MRRPAILFLALGLACTPFYTGPKPPPPPKDMTPLQASEEVTWHTAIRVLATHDLPIEDLRRRGGWIETQVRPVDQSAAAGWADCVDQLQNSIAGPDRLAALVRVVKLERDRTKISVEAEWSYSQDPNVTCQSRGVWERNMLTMIKQAAEQEARREDADN